MLSITHLIRWPVTIMVFSRDIIILIICTLLYATGTMKVFRPTWFGKANTAAQIVTVPLVLLAKITGAHWARLAMLGGIGATMALTIISGVHYVLRLAFDLRSAGNKADATAPESGD
jgi:cardiolipin synthase (CMP-forming)